MNQGTRQPRKVVPKGAVPAWIIFAALVTIAFIAYQPAMRGGFIWDDDDYVTQNQTLRSVDGLRRIWFEFGATRQYYPLVYSTFWVEYHAWGLQPIGYHVVNVLLHGLGAGLLWLVLRRLAAPGALVAAAIFALHPVHVESVAWITERKNVLSGLFYFAAALAYFHWTRVDAIRDKKPPSGQPPATHGKALYLAVLVLFACALLSKTVTCSLPAAILLVLWWKHGRITQRDVLSIAPMLVLGIALGLTTAWMENTHVGAGGPEWSRTFGVRLITAGRAFWFYLGKIFWPANLAFVYPRWALDPGDLSLYAFPITACGLIATLWLLRKRFGKGPLIAMLYFAGTLLPALGFFNVFYAIRFSPVADHFQYLASVGPITLFAAMATILYNAVAARGFLRNAIRGLGITVVAALAMLTWRQCRIYENLETLWTDTLKKNPNAGLAHQGMGAILQRKGDFAEAARCYSRAIDLDPPDSKTLFNLGTVLQQLGKLDDAVSRYEAALLLEPNYAKCLVNYGNALLAKGRAQHAVEALIKAVQAQPDYSLAHANLATAYERVGRSREALAEYREAVRLNPKDVQSMSAVRRLESDASPSKP